VEETIGCEVSVPVSHIGLGTLSHSPTRLRLLGDSGLGTCVSPIPRPRVGSASSLVLNRAKEDAVPVVDLSMVEQRYDAVREVLDGATVKDTAIRYGVERRTLHRWLLRYANEGLAALADKSSRPDRCPHQMAPEIEDASSSCAAAIPAGVPAPSSTSYGGSSTSLHRAQRSIAVSCDIVWSNRNRGDGGATTTSAGSGRARWSCGR
jgi:transposase-like protein